MKNLGDGAMHPFDGKLFDRYANDAAKHMFRLTIRSDGTAPTPAVLATTGTSVDINNGTQADGNSNGVAAIPEQWANMVFDSDSLVGAQDQDLLIDDDETFSGMYFGASGKFQCLAVQNTTTGCKLKRNADGTVGVVDTNSAMAGIQGSGRWSFTPAPVP